MILPAAYSLDQKVAASLQVPRIRYPNNIVPRSVIERTVIDENTGFTGAKYPQLNKDMNIDELLRLISEHRTPH